MKTAKTNVKDHEQARAEITFNGKPALMSLDWEKPSRFYIHVRGKGINKVISEEYDPRAVLLEWTRAMKKYGGELVARTPKQRELVQKQRQLAADFRDPRSAFFAPGFLRAVRMAYLKEIRYGKQVEADLKMSPKDKKVLDAFTSEKPGDSKKFHSDGKVLDGLWMGGNKIAWWQGGKLHIRNPTGRADQTVARALKKMTPKNLLAGSVRQAAPKFELGQKVQLLRGPHKGRTGKISAIIDNKLHVNLDGPPRAWDKPEVVDPKDVKLKVPLKFEKKGTGKFFVTGVDEKKGVSYQLRFPTEEEAVSAAQELSKRAVDVMVSKMGQKRRHFQKGKEVRSSVERTAAPDLMALHKKAVAAWMVFSDAAKKGPYDRQTEVLEQAVTKALSKFWNHAKSKKTAGAVSGAEGDKAAYKAYFDKKMKEWGIKSPEDLDDAKKKKFFEEVDKGWKADSEGAIHGAESGDKSAYKAYFDKKMKAWGINSPDELDEAKKKKFFEDVDKGWKGEKEGCGDEPSAKMVRPEEIEGALPPPAEQLKMMSANPPRLKGTQIEIFSPTVKKYIGMAEWPDAASAKKDLASWMAAHKETLTKLKALASGSAGVQGASKLKKVQRPGSKSMQWVVVRDGQEIGLITKIKTTKTDIGPYQAFGSASGKAGPPFSKHLGNFHSQAEVVKWSKDKQKPIDLGSNWKRGGQAAAVKAIEQAAGRTAAVQGRKDPQIAKTILKQLGGSGRLSAMLGAKHFIDHGNGLSFQFPNPKRNRGNYFKVILDEGQDLYDLEIGKASRANYKKLKDWKGVQASELKRIFEGFTGLRMSL